MTTIHMIELGLNPVALFRYARAQGLPTSPSTADLGYEVHCWLAAAFGSLAPRPWRLFIDRNRPPRLLGYGTHDAHHLCEHLRSFADPTVAEVCPASEIASKPIPQWQSGRRMAFEVLCCPVGRKSRQKTEKDLFLLRADSGNDPPRRDVLYGQWAKERIERDGTAKVIQIQLAGFRLVRQLRQTQANGKPRTPTFSVRPQALLRGELTVEQPSEFARLLTHGVGRHRAFGYGMLLLRPPT